MGQVGSGAQAECARPRAQQDRTGTVCLEDRDDLPRSIAALPVVGSPSMARGLLDVAAPGTGALRWRLMHQGEFNKSRQY